MSSEAKHDERLMCRPIQVAYSFIGRMGQLFMDEGNCCDMAGCVALFESIDRNVTRIETYQGIKTDTTYLKTDKGWIAKQ